MASACRAGGVPSCDPGLGLTPLLSHGIPASAVFLRHLWTQHTTQIQLQFPNSEAHMSGERGPWPPVMGAWGTAIAAAPRAETSWC